jgi:AraC family transcriptional regulator
MSYYYKSILKAVEYIEENISNDIELSQVIKFTGFSQFHFMRIFKSIAGYTVTDYIRRRRLTKAAGHLLNTDMKIIDIAVLNGYSSQEAFSRAFKEMFNVTPNYYRTNKISYKNLEQLVLTENLLNLKTTVKIIEPMIMERDSFIIAGIEYRGKNSNYEIPKMWNQFSGCMKRIPNRINNRITYGFEDYNEGIPVKGFRYIAGVEVSKCDNMPENIAVQKIEKSSYAVFPIHSITESIPNSISQIYSIHLPNWGLKIKGNYDFEYYDSNFKSNREDSLIYLYIPIETGL